MTRKKKSQSGLNPKGESVDGARNNPVTSTTQTTLATPSAPIHSVSSKTPPAAASKSSKPKTFEQSTSALIICRNKHWRYISSFHGPWLQLPPEVLESLAYSNYASPRPQPIDPAVFFDLVKIRRLIEEATDLAVRAANGTTSSALSNSQNAINGLLSSGSSTVLGIGIGGGGGTARLSKERRHRMREHATQKLSLAYHLDEIAASVATMQSASALEEVAKLVLQRNEQDCNAKYVHFFHEKIPSRSLAQCTNLQPLDEVIARRPREGAFYRTRAVTRVFMDDYVGAARDLTKGLNVCRLQSAQHGTSRVELEKRRRGLLPRDFRYDLKVEEKDQPSSLEHQLVFHRGGVYLTIACQNINSALDALSIWQKEQLLNPNLEGEDNVLSTLSPAGKEAYRRWLETRKMVKSNARRALRDYLKFLSNFDYTPGLPAELAEEFLRKVNITSGAHHKSGGTRTQESRLIETLRMAGTSPSPGSPTSEGRGGAPAQYQLPPTEIYPVSVLFSEQPPSNLPPFPTDSQALVRPQPNGLGISPTHADAALLANCDCHEAVTYHPLLTDALHSVLLCHALLQTSSKELLRHAHMVARLARVCDGYPIFLAPRSPARADWIEVMHRVDNWLGLKLTWEALCAPAPLPGHHGHPRPEKKRTTEDEIQERRKYEAIMEALSDDRVQDEESFLASVRAREKRAGEQRMESHPSVPYAGPAPKRWEQEDGKEYPISTERAEFISRWIIEAPMSSGDGKGKGKRRKGRATVDEVEDDPSLEDILHELTIGDHDGLG
ncbi:uncharacterized protein PADG_02773 [Paracoccidioides brasiliensis Pb18]|uniref:Uncharacterized protein n=1 Tax=Paracoccidioides brasiliensis (strain Pb18) TaxID=502780 RepID=C1G6G8_PARBD|nr:uncharacterized protein PADG_02773 [Paracoccidioides brasiliensis Pb18]EEH46675.2 hypothetical protein PADG_02773 [Paracoccidioides brasiliensis Pb18]